MIGSCFECGKVGQGDFHHVVPKSKGGTRSVFLCLYHHGLVHGIKRVHHKELQAAGIAAAKKAGKYWGRKKGTLKARPDIAFDLQNEGWSGDEIALILSVSRPTVFRYLKQAKG